MNLDQTFYKLREILHQYRIEIGVFFVIFGSVLVFLSGFGILAEDGSDSIFISIKDLLGGWIYWMIVIGTIMLLLGLFYLFDFISKRREFYKLFEEESKSKFIKNQDRIEELAWRLNPKFEKMVIEKKAKWRIK